MATEEPIRFGGGDYAVFALMLCVSLAIGIFYAIRDRRSKDVQEYLMGGRNMNFWSVGISISYTFASAVTILGVPAEIYIFGAMYCWLVVTPLLVVPIITEIYIPLYFRLNLTSCYEYLQLRYNYSVRLIGTAAYIAQTILYLGVMIYAPSLAFSQVSGFNLWAAIFSTGIVCTLYTTLGGLKAVVWSDVFQGIIVILVLLIAMFMSAAELGGWDTVWAASREGQRLDFFVFDLDPRVRHTVWSILFGIGFLWIASFATAQSQVQRYIACRNESDAKKGLIFGMVVSVVTVLLCYFIGWVMYAYFNEYKKCDPLINGQISAPDQMLPLMIMQTFRNFPGLSGLFMAGVFAGCLSTISSGINAMACVSVEDFIKPFVEWSESTLTIVSKLLALFFGLTSIGFACLSSVLGGVLQTSLSMLGMLGGPLLGIFTLGIVFPFTNIPGVISGFVVGLALAIWIYVGSTQYRPGPQFLRPKTRTISGCGVDAAATESLNVTLDYITTTMSTAILESTQNVTKDFQTTLPPSPSPLPAEANLYHVSYGYLAPIGLGVTLIVGIVVSLLTCGHRHCGEVDPKLIVPLFDHKVLKYLTPKSFRKKMWCGVEHERTDNVWSTRMEGKTNEAMEYYDAVETTPASTLRKRIEVEKQKEANEEPSQV